MNIDSVLQEYDRLSRNFETEKLEPFLTDAIADAIREDDSAGVLVLLNELIGYYREVNEYEKGALYGRKALELIEDMGLTGTVHHATTLINHANGLRAAGNFEESLSAYEEASGIYDSVLEPGAFEFASLYNNMSLLYMETGEFEKARDFQRKALAIVEAHAEGNGFELAVSHTNLGNTLIRLNEDEEALFHLNAAVAIFDGRRLYDTHYAAAMAGLGELRERQEDSETAISLYLRGIRAILDNFGVTDYYYRLKERYDRCLDSCIKKNGDIPLAAKSGLEICRAYFEEVALPSLKEKYPHILEIAAIGLAGQGSECYGMDDIFSRDHDWGPGFCIWLSGSDHEKYGEALTEWYASLDREFHGLKRNESFMGKGRVGVFSFEGFVKDILVKDGDILLKAARDGGKLADDKWLSYEEYALASLTNGELYCDGKGFFTRLRNYLKHGYPRSLKAALLKLHCMEYAQSLQYNFRRMALRGDSVSARYMMDAGFKAAAKISALVHGRFLLHDKWILRQDPELFDHISAVDQREKALSYKELTESRLGPVLKSIADLTAYLGHILGEAGFVSRQTVEKRDLYLEDVAMELKDHNDLKYVYEHLRDGSWDEERLCAFFEDQRKDDLPEMIAALEFDAFDEVKNEGGRASCQDNWSTFSLMRKSQYNCWNKELMVRYATDFMLSMRDAWNPITEKYGRMEESTAPEKWEKIKDSFPEIDEESRAVIEAVVSLQVSWMEEFAKKYPRFASGARVIHTCEDTPEETSYETYLRGEISSYSPEMLKMYAQFVADTAAAGKNLAYMTMNETAKLYGYENVDAAEKKL